MDSVDMPVVEERVRVAEIRRADSKLQISQASDSKVQLNELMEKIKRNASASAGGAKLENEGQISSMRVPAGWLRSSIDQHPTPTSNYVEFHSQKDPEQRMGTYYRGHRISALAAKHFHEMLMAKEHNLDEAEYLALEEVLRDKAKLQDFEPTSKKSMDINGRRVLFVEGKFKQIKQRSLSLFVDAEDNGEVVQEIFYQAPEADYGNYRQAAEDSIKSIIWK